MEMNGLRNSVSTSQIVKAIAMESSPVLLEAGGGGGDREAQSVPYPPPVIAYLQASRSPLCQVKPLLSGKSGDCLGGLQFLEMQRFCIFILG